MILKAVIMECRVEGNDLADALETLSGRYRLQKASRCNSGKAATRTPLFFFPRKGIEILSDSGLGNMRSAGTAVRIWTTGRNATVRSGFSSKRH